MTPEQINEMYQAVGRIEGKQDLILHHLVSHDVRVERLEKKVNYGMGVLGTLVFMWPFIWASIKAKLGIPWL